MNTGERQIMAMVERQLAELSLERKVAQLVTVAVPDVLVAVDEPQLAQWLTLAGDHGFGSFVIYGGTPGAVAHLTNRLQAAAQVPLLFASDYEGGAGQQVSGATEFPANMAFAAAGSEELMYRASSIFAIEGRALGVHVTYSPVVDVSLRPSSPAESVRSFGGDVDLLGRLTRAHVRGLHDHGMLATAKHFPGRGDVVPMPGRPSWLLLDKSRDELESTELTAFRHAIAAGVDFVMTEHIAVPSLTEGSDLPASVEGRLTREWLRDRLGFTGIVTSDDLWYEHVVARFGAEEVGVRAFEAGHDMLLKPNDPIATIAALVAAVRSGRVSGERVDDAVRRLLTLKARLGLFEQRFVDEALVEQSVGTEKHRAVAQEVADRSLTCLRNDGVLPVAGDATSAGFRVVNVNIEKVAGDSGPVALEVELRTAFPSLVSFTLGPGTGAAQHEVFWAAAQRADLIILSLFVQRDKYGEAAPLRDADLALLDRITTARPGAVVVMSYGNPHVIGRVPNAAAFLVGYGERGMFGNQSTYFKSFVRALKGQLTPTGRLPVHVSAAYPVGYRQP